MWRETVEWGYWQEKLREIRSDIEQGCPYGPPSRRPLFLRHCVFSSFAPEKWSGSLDVMLMNLARHHTEQTFQQADNLAALLEPFATGRDRSDYWHAGGGNVSADFPSGDAMSVGVTLAHGRAPAVAVRGY